MVSRELTVNNPSGLHARPATMLVKKASSFYSEVYIEFKGKKANVKSLIGVLSLGITKGSPIIIQANGTDEKEAVDELYDLICSLEQ